MRGEFVDLAGARLYYYAAGTRGAAEPVVLLHGLGTSGRLWSEVAPLLPSGRRLVVVDLLGHGRSDPPGSAGLSLSAHAARVVALLDALGIASACMVGHGMGGGIAQALAVTHPARVSHLALVGSIAFGDGLLRDLTVARALLPVLRHLPPAWLLSMVRGEMERGYADPSRAAHALDGFGRPFTTAAGRDVLRRHLLALDRRETRALGARLHEIPAPTAVVWGADDPLVRPGLGRRLAAAIPGATLDVVPGARHFLPADAPRPLADAIERLLARPTSPGARRSRAG